MVKVGILMGSDSDLPIMQKAAQMLEKFGIEYEMTIISAHRMPDVFVDYATKAEERGIEVIIAGAGGAAHLPGMCAALFDLSVFQSIQNRLAVSTVCTPSYRCHPEFRLLPWQSMAQPMQVSLLLRFFRYRIWNCVRN